MPERTPEQEARQRAIAARLAEFLEQKKAAQFAKQQATKQRRRSYDRAKSRTAERATPQFAAAVHSPFAAPIAEVPLSY